MSSAAAYFDVLGLGHRMTGLVEGFTRPEVHLFAYAGCLLSLYDGRPTADWGYDFASTEAGLPFSKDLDDSLETAISLGHAHSHGSLYVISGDGEGELSDLRCLCDLSNRERYLEGAADALLVMNPGNVREAFNYDPAISFLKSGNRTDWVLTPPVVDRFYANFNQLRTALAYSPSDLSIPLVGWLKYLLQTGRSNLDARASTIG